tara:strand:+ start:57 stop:251 length:195 start_codon:yes stop_codon:yes gene_type:complete
MTIKELRDKIKDCPDEMIVGSTGWFGEYLECYSIDVEEVCMDMKFINKKIILNISIEPSGDEPD